VTLCGWQGDLGLPSCGCDGEEEKGAATSRGWHRWRWEAVLGESAQDGGRRRSGETSMGKVTGLT
jgi:hypothetical protein